MAVIVIRKNFAMVTLLIPWKGILLQFTYLFALLVEETICASSRLIVT